METQSQIIGINGSVVTLPGDSGFVMKELVCVGRERLVGEVIGVSSRKTIVQVYENTTGLRVGEPVETTGGPLCALLGPGILNCIFDGIERPLKTLEEQSGAFLGRGAQISSLDPERTWEVTVTVQPGDRLEGGQVYATCPETKAVVHRCMVPPTVSGTVTWVADGCAPERELPFERYGH